MSFKPPLRKSKAPPWLMLVVVIGVFAPAPPAAAASNHQNYRSGNSDSTPFHVDQDPCRGQRRGRGGDDSFCNDFSSNGSGGHSGSHRPGSNAFGLQFNNDGY